MFQRCSKGVPKVFQRCSKGVHATHILVTNALLPEAGAGGSWFSAVFGAERLKVWYLKVCSRTVHWRSHQPSCLESYDYHLRHKHGPFTSCVCAPWQDENTAQWDGYGIWTTYGCIWHMDAHGESTKTTLHNSLQNRYLRISCTGRWPDEVEMHGMHGMGWDLKEAKKMPKKYPNIIWTIWYYTLRFRYYLIFD